MSSEIVLSRKKSVAKFLRDQVPILLLIGIGYLEYCYSYRFCYDMMYRSRGHHGTGVAFLVVSNTILLLALCLWGQIILTGPGDLAIQVPPYDLSNFLNPGADHSKEDFIEPPDWFMCDRNGLPFWCPICKTIKVFRSHHSSDTGRCVPRFDHYCLYLRSVIGIRNYKLFMLFLMVMFTWFLFMFVSLACFIPEINDYRGVSNRLIPNPNLIVFLIASIFWAIMTGALLSSHLYLIYKNMTTVESLQVDKRKRKNTQVQRFVNFKHPKDPSKRFVMPLEPKDLPHNSSFYSNLCDLTATSGLSLFIPFNIHTSKIFKGGDFIRSTEGFEGIANEESKSFSSQFKSKIVSRLENNEGFQFGITG